MKSAEQWAEERFFGFEPALDEPACVRDIEAIQLDAWKEGMEHAATLCIEPLDADNIRATAKQKEIP